MPNVYKGSKFDYKELVSQMEKMTLLNNKNIKENNKDFLSKYAINTHTSNEIESLVLLKKMINEISMEEMKAIVASYLSAGVSQSDVVLRPIQMPHSSYFYEINDAYLEKLNELFWSDFPAS